MANSKNILLIMGNGFDLSCGLKSSYNDFFEWRKNNLDRIIEKSGLDEKTFDEYVENEINSIGYKKNFNEDLREKTDKEYLKNNPITRWDCVFVLVKKYISPDHIKEWNDVENVILNVVTFLLVNDKKWLNLKIREDQNKFFSEEVKRCFYSKKPLENNKAILSKRMLDDLNIFESNFANYIRGEVHSNELYKISARELIKKLARRGVKEGEIANVDIFSFNYSLDADQRRSYNEYFERTNCNLRINSWYNIHGIVESRHMSMKKSNIIFGIDMTDLLDNNKQSTLTNTLLNDPRIEFTKSFRIISEHVNLLRDTALNSEEDKIIIYGHSLNAMDYSYFRTLFEMFRLYESNKMALELYYYPMNDTDTIHTEERANVEKLVNLLVTYSKTLGNQYENSIVDKLVLENRLSVISTGKENEYNKIKSDVINDIKPIIEIGNKKGDPDLLSPTEKFLLGTVLSNIKPDISEWTDNDLNSFINKLKNKGYMDRLINAFKKNEDILKNFKELADFIGED